MPRRGHSTTIGKFAKVHQDRRASEIRMFGELLRSESLRNERGAGPRQGSLLEHIREIVAVR